MMFTIFFRFHTPHSVVKCLTFYSRMCRDIEFLSLNAFSKGNGGSEEGAADSLPAEFFGNMEVG